MVKPSDNIKIRAIGKAARHSADDAARAIARACAKRAISICPTLRRSCDLEKATFERCGHVGACHPRLSCRRARDTLLNTGDFCVIVPTLMRGGLRQSSRVRLVAAQNDLFYINNPNGTTELSDFRDQLGKLALHVNTWMVTSTL